MDVEIGAKHREATGDTQNRYLTFFTGSQLFGLPIGEIIQITQMQEIIPIPEQPHYIKGIINMRGQIIPVIDMRLRFGMMEAEFTDRTCIIIVRVDDVHFGLIVDDVDEVADIEVEQISVPSTFSGEVAAMHDYMTGIARLPSGTDEKEKVALLLQAGKLLQESELMSFSSL